MKLIPSLSTLAVAAALTVAAPASQAAVILYFAQMDGPSEAPPNASSGTGYAYLTYDSTAQTLAISAEWADLTGTTTVAHIHCCTPQPFQSTTAAVAVTPTTLPLFPAGTTSGTYNVVLDLTAGTTYTAGFVNNFAGGVLADAEEALIAAFEANTAYFNIHSTFASGGEIRGFIAAAPEPATLALLGLGLAGLGMSRRRAR